MVDHGRARKLGERIKVLVVDALVKVVKDPGLGFVTITDVRVTPDLMHAKIYYTVMGSEEDIEQSIEVLDQNKGRIRGEIGHKLSIRLTPTIELIRDDVPEVATALADLLAEAKRRDEEVQKLSKNAQPAGDADPYVKPRVQED